MALCYRKQQPILALGLCLEFKHLQIRPAPPDQQFAEQQWHEGSPAGGAGLHLLHAWSFRKISCRKRPGRTHRHGRPCLLLRQKSELTFKAPRRVRPYTFYLRMVPELDHRRAPRLRRPYSEDGTLLSKNDFQTSNGRGTWP